MDDSSELPASDAELLAAIAGGDQESLATLYDRYAPQILAVCLRIVRRHADAEAVLSDVFWQIWSQAGRYNPNRGSPRTFLITLTRSRAIDRWRSIAARLSRERGAADDVLDDQATGRANEEPGRIAIAGEEVRLVREALRSLHQSQREALELAYFEGRTHREIAGDLDLPLGTVKTHIRQGLIKLRQSLGACEASGRVR
jgi:RNA polymerase sigma-70 factor (ECF subfamily)